ncbi:MAG: dihydroxy-acid dehydratase [Propionibacteriales bacterium]|nr:dihydroxy-acid dehydratase [Propionibacteriales bacterium]
MNVQGISRSLVSYGDAGFSRFLRNTFLASAGYSGEELSRPVIGVADLSSDYNPCHRQMDELVANVKRGVLAAGGIPFVFPTISLGETFLNPTSMLYRNLLAMETEELIRAQPMDAAVLLGGCDKTVPAQLMAAAVSEVPVILDVVGPMLTSSWRGERLGACTDCRRFWARYRAGGLSEAEIDEVEVSLASTSGTCMVMGTASTMGSVTEALGMMLPGGATPPSPTGDRLRHGTATGARAVELARQPVLPREIMTAEAFENALRVLAALGGSTNAVVHLLAIARRAGVPLQLDDFDRVSRDTPLLVDLKPSGAGYMEDFHRAGGVPVLLKSLERTLHVDHVGVCGRSLADVLAEVEPPAQWQEIIRTVEQPVGPPGALAVLRGSLAPDGAVIKVSAASPELAVHEGPALVFDSPEEAAERLDDPDLDVTADHVLVLRNAGPVAAGMPEAGSLPIPKRLAGAGVTDMARVSDARMSGTSYGTVVLHCTPESAVGGPLAQVRDGDLIRLDVPHRTLDLLVAEEELAGRRAAWQPPEPPQRGWRRLYAQTVLPASLGADLDFL